MNYEIRPLDPEALLAGNQHDGVGVMLPDGAPLEVVPVAHWSMLGTITVAARGWWVRPVVIDPTIRCPTPRCP